MKNWAAIFYVWLGTSLVSLNQPLCIISEVNRTIRRCLFIVQTSDRIYAIFFFIFALFYSYIRPFFFFLQDKFHSFNIQDDRSTCFPSTTNYKNNNNIKRLLWRIHYWTGLFSQVNNGPWAKTFEKIIF